MVKDAGEGKKIRLFVDLDGTAAEFRVVDTLEVLYEEGYFLNLRPQQNVVDAVRNIINNHPEVEVYILSAVLSDSKYALKEKNAWIDKYLPEITPEHRIFPPCGAEKKDFIEGGIGITDFLLDDYSVNLNSWEPPARGVKLMNGINGTKGTWQSNKLSIMKDGAELADNLLQIMSSGAYFEDAGPIDNDARWSIKTVELDELGCGYAEILLSEFVDGKINDFCVKANFTTSYSENGENITLESMDANIFEHPVLEREWDTIENAVAKEVENTFIKSESEKQKADLPGVFHKKGR